MIKISLTPDNSSGRRLLILLSLTKFLFMKSFLCALDFTDASDQVLKVASELALQCQAQLTILFPYRLIQTEPSDEATILKGKIEANARNKFSTLENEYNLPGSLHYTFKPEIGFLSDRIEVHSRKNLVHMVILSQEQALSMHDQKGETLQQFLGELKIPYLIVPKTKVQVS